MTIVDHGRATLHRSAVACLLNQRAAKLLREVLPADVPLEICNTQEELHDRLTTGHAVLGVFDIQDKRGGLTLPLVHQIRAARPEAVLVLFCALRPSSAAQVLEFARAGINELILRDVDDLGLMIQLALQRWRQFERARIETPDASTHLVQVSRELNDALLERLAADPRLMYQLTPHKFEEIVGELLARQGFDVTATKASRDGGRDLIVRCHSSIASGLYFVECKRWAPDNHVGVGVLRTLYGVVESEGVTGGMIATTSTFTRDAQAYQQSIAYRLSLRDFSDLASWLKRLASGRE